MSTLQREMSTEALNRWSDEVITVKDVVILADKAESEDKE